MDFANASKVLFKIVSEGVSHVTPQDMSIIWSYSPVKKKKIQGIYMLKF